MPLDLRCVVSCDRLLLSTFKQLTIGQHDAKCIEDIIAQQHCEVLVLLQDLDQGVVNKHLSQYRQNRDDQLVHVKPTNLIGSTPQSLDHLQFEDQQGLQAL